MDDESIEMARALFGTDVVPDMTDFVPLADYSRALDEIWHLRQALAYEAMASEVHGEYKTFPKSRRKHLEAQIERMKTAARGRVQVAYADRPHYALTMAAQRAQIPTTLTRSQWEAEKEKN